MLIEVFGPGCSKCHRSAATAAAYLRTRGLEGEVVERSEVDEMVARGVLFTPTVFVDGVKVLEGRMLREKDLDAWLRRRAG